MQIKYLMDENLPPIYQIQHRKNTLLPRDFLENGKKGDRASASASQMHWINCHAIATDVPKPQVQN